jgi:hypothetical protein
MKGSRKRVLWSRTPPIYSVGIRTIRLFVLALVGCVLFGFHAPPVAAQQQVAGIKITPTRYEVTISPGTTKASSFRVTNTHKEAMKVELSSEEFTVVNQDYHYSFDQLTSEASWVRFSENSLTLQPQESRSIAFDIMVPLSAEPGGRYLSIFANTNTAQQEGAITSRQRVALLLYITVDGEVTRSGAVHSLSHPWFLSTNSSWSVTVQNQGTAHFRSRYSVIATTLLGSVSVASINGDALILPGTLRRVTDALPVPQLPGIYSVRYEIGLGDQPAYTLTRLLVYVPLWLQILLGIIALLGAGLWMRRKHTG